jgi:hypothetical protein
MRTHSALSLVISSVFLLSLVSVAQSGDRGVAGYCPYACGPYVPLITTPSISFETVSPNPVGATNATGGLRAGAANSTLSEITGNTDAVYTRPVWYSGGGMPLVSPATNSLVGDMRLTHPERRAHVEPARAHEAATQAWVYFASAETGARSLEAAAKGAHPGKRSFTNDDVQRQNDKNGDVHYDGKSEKVQ